MKKPASTESAVRPKKSRAASSASPKRRKARPAGPDATTETPGPTIDLGPPGNPQFSSLLVASGAAPVVGTVVYVHGIGNKPLPSILKCQWDQALFDGPMGDRTRMAYWVDRARYPVAAAGSCASGDLISGDPADSAAAAPGTRSWSPHPGVSQPVNQQEFVDMIEHLAQTNEQRDHLTAMALRLLDHAAALQHAPETRIGPRVLPLPAFMRRFVTRFLTTLFLQDVSEFLFHEERRKQMEQSLIERLRGGGGPFVIVAHSLGSMIAFNVLRQLRRADCDVRLFLTIGSPLGMAEVQDVMKSWMPSPTWAVPDCVEQWINVADRLDLVAIDATLADEFGPSAHGVRIVDHGGDAINRDAPDNPHSATGYLASDTVRVAVRSAVGNAFSQLVGKAIVVRDLADRIEDAPGDTRHPTLIQLISGEGFDGHDRLPLAESREAMLLTLERLVGSSGTDLRLARIQEMKRFIAADLTRLEIESLRSQHSDFKIEKVWRNAVKRALINQSTQTVQARPGNLGYGALGQRIGWAVLDTGIRADHPHFLKHGNVVQQWDCTTDGAAIAFGPNDPKFMTLDNHGHGTHVAGIICGEVALPPDSGKPEETYAGMAPATRLFGFKVLKDSGQGEDAFIIKALDAIAELNERAGELIIHGVNLSLGGEFDPSVYGCAHTPLCQELRRLWNQGVLVCLAAGNEGYATLQGTDRTIGSNMDLSIGDPANLEEAIAVGSVHKSKPHTYGVSYFSSRGPTADGRAKPDLVAPGEQIVSAWHRAPAHYQSARDLYVEMSGTSMATPHVSGLLAAFLSVRREFIGYPDRVKQILLESCTDIGRDPYIQGKGLPNLVQMLIRT